jgi:nitroimidazol reductase NimA-like FMN-containing flavoprotein (pyridoxamine 5'-phosphate oxidase superfamily)
MSSDETLQTERTTVKRLPKRAAYDRAAVEAILDEGLVCHVGFAVHGQPYVIPTIYARVGDELFVHGSAASRMLESVGDGIATCLTVTLLDGLVLARSAFHHSVNYRSVVVLGTARPLVDADDKTRALRAIVDHVVPGRWPHVRWPNAKELKATTVLSIPLREASAKVRTGGPIDDEEDYAIPVWAGQVPIATRLEPVVPDERLAAGLAVPDYVTGYPRRRF